MSHPPWYVLDGEGEPVLDGEGNPVLDGTAPPPSSIVPLMGSL